MNVNVNAVAAHARMKIAGGVALDPTDAHAARMLAATVL